MLPNVLSSRLEVPISRPALGFMKKTLLATERCPHAPSPRCTSHFEQGSRCIWSFPSRTPWLAACGAAKQKQGCDAAGGEEG